jgi:hypothetical protein
VRIVGGLGNQMFGAAAGMALAKRLGASLELEHYQFRASSAQTLPYQLSAFNLPATQSPAPRRWLNPMKVWRQAGHHYDPEFEQLSGSVYLKGYFQSWRYFQGAATEVRKALDLEPAISATGRRMAADAEMAGERSVAVHLRRGDYTQHAERFALLQKDYYERAIRLLTRAVDRPKFFVVSDDAAAARAMFEGFPDSTYAVGGTAFDDMHLIAACHHHVIANSSFSWWGAWLSPWRDGLTVAPRAWFSRQVAVQTYMDDTFPPGWILI